MAGSQNISTSPSSATELILLLSPVKVYLQVTGSEFLRCLSSPLAASPSTLPPPTSSHSERRWRSRRTWGTERRWTKGSVSMQSPVYRSTLDLCISVESKLVLRLSSYPTLYLAWQIYLSSNSTLGLFPFSDSMVLAVFSRCLLLNK